MSFNSTQVLLLFAVCYLLSAAWERGWWNYCVNEGVPKIPEICQRLEDHEPHDTMEAQKVLANHLLIVISYSRKISYLHRRWTRFKIRACWSVGVLVDLSWKTEEAHRSYRCSILGQSKATQDNVETLGVFNTCCTESDEFENSVTLVLWWEIALFARSQHKSLGVCFSEHIL